jgi:dinuclear metal center YbgI/SA1388 family protein
MTCLTITPPVVQEAISQNADVIITHHPVLFRPTKALCDSTTEGAILLDLIQHGIAVYSAHTAFDNCQNGINSFLAERLGLTHVRPLRAKSQPQYKLVVFTPESDRERLLDAVFAAGAGQIGAYRECSFRTPGTGTFYGTESSNPVVGQRGQREHVPEERIEVLVPAARLRAVLQAMRSAHSYEEPAYDVIPLQSLPEATKTGEGRYGTLAQALPLATIATQLKTELNAGVVQRIGAKDRMIRTVAIACGAAGEFLKDALRVRADLFVTGELRFHDGLAAEAAGIAVLLPGHFASERPAMEWFARHLQEQFPQLTVWPAASEQDPFHPE